MEHMRTQIADYLRFRPTQVRSATRFWSGRFRMAFTGQVISYQGDEADEIRPYPFLPAGCHRRASVLAHH